MQAVILVAGEGKRMQPLTFERPKPLIKVAGRPLLEHIIDALPKEVTDIILVIGYKGEMIKDHFGSLYKDRSIAYVVQKEPLGTGHALSLARPFLSGRFLLMFGDDIHGAEALRELIEKPSGLLVAESPTPERFGVVYVNPDGTMQKIVEKPQHPESNLVYAGPMVLDERIFDFPAPRNENGEYYLTDSFTQFAAKYPAYVVRQPLWISIGYPEDIKKAEVALADINVEPGRSL
ncbi:MAG: sugar phosphate nucleotidyltransferase [bacterium]|nr:sugar phosphate nucleotidyltransferase [bacterium]